MCKYFVIKTIMNRKNYNIFLCIFRFFCFLYFLRLILYFSILFSRFISLHMFDIYLHKYCVHNFYILKNNHSIFMINKRLYLKCF